MIFNYIKKITLSDPSHNTMITSLKNYVLNILIPKIFEKDIKLLVKNNNI